MPFLDTLVTPEPDRTLSTTVYRKPTQTYQYLHWDSHHNLPAQYSVLNTLTQTTRTVCSNLRLLQKVEEHIRWCLSKMQLSNLGSQQTKNKKQ